MDQRLGKESFVVLCLECVLENELDFISVRQHEFPNVNTSTVKMLELSLK